MVDLSSSGEGANLSELIVDVQRRTYFAHYLALLDAECIESKLTQVANRGDHTAHAMVCSLKPGDSLRISLHASVRILECNMF